MKIKISFKKLLNKAEKGSQITPITELVRFVKQNVVKVNKTKLLSSPLDVYYHFFKK